MNVLPSKCPLCDGEIAVTRIHCRECDTTLDGRFSTETPFSQLSREQLSFVETFVRCEGKIKSMESELRLSYPTIRNRLHEIIRALGYEPGGSEEAPAAPGLTNDDRQRILEELDKGLISAEKAMQMLQES